jgi:hypothetical protein
MPPKVSALVPHSKMDCTTWGGRVRAREEEQAGSVSKNLNFCYLSIVSPTMNDPQQARGKHALVSDCHPIAFSLASALPSLARLPLLHRIAGFAIIGHGILFCWKRLRWPTDLSFSRLLFWSVSAISNTKRNTN